MTTSIKNLIATTLTAIVLSTSAFAADTYDNVKNTTTLNDVKNINKIKVSGNVELILVQSNTPGIKIYDNYYSKNALVQQQNGELLISSFQKEKLTVVVNVKTLESVTATDNASVHSFGKLNLLSLDVKLKNNAVALLDLSTIKLTTSVEGNSNLTLLGNASDVYANVASVAKLNMDKFAAENTKINAKNSVAAKIQSDDLYTLGLGK